MNIVSNEYPAYKARELGEALDLGLLTKDEARAIYAAQFKDILDDRDRMAKVRALLDGTQA